MILDQTLPYLLYGVAKQNEERPALMFKDESGDYLTWTYGDLLNYTSAFALSALDLGLKRGDRVFFFLDNCKEWAVADFAVMSLGMINVPRGTDVSDKDLKLFIEHVEANAIIFHGEHELKRLKELGLLTQGRFLICLDSISKDLKEEYNIHLFQDLVDSGMELPGQKHDFLLEEINKAQITDIVTITYTSGTSDNPKGVCLNHRTFSFQLREVMRSVPIRYRQERILTILPIWHAYERIIQYISFYAAAVVMYSKPVGKIFLADIQKTHPTIIPGVPRVFESVYHGVMNKVKKQKPVSRGLFHFFYWCTGTYNTLLDFKENNYFHTIAVPTFIKLFLDIFCSIGLFLLYPFQLLGYLLVFRKINKAFGKKLRFLLSGGAHLPIFVDKFFRNIKVGLIEGYGMTELGPLVAARGFPRGKMGSTNFLEGVDFYLQDDKGNRNSKKGELFIRSPQNMIGYYKNTKASEETLIDGYLRTGDIVQIDVGQSMRVIGRSKNIVCLANGENIETEPLEVALSQSPYIAYSIIVGQDEKFLGVLIVPNFIELANYAQENNIMFENKVELCKDPQIHVLYKNFIQTTINKSKEFGHTPIGDFHIIPKEFEVNKELTLTLKVKRTYVQKHYFKEIKSLYNK